MDDITPVGAFGAWLHDELRAAGCKTLRQSELYTGVSRSSLSEYMAGQRFPNRAVLAKLAARLGVPIADLLAMAPDGPVTRPVYDVESVFRVGSAILGVLREQEIPDDDIPFVLDEAAAAVKEILAQRGRR